MSVADLIRRADAIRAKARLLESIPGSGLHDNDRNPARPDLFLAPQRNGLPKQSEHLVFFADYLGEEFVFAGRDADLCAAVLADWRAKAAKLDPLTLTGTERKLLARILPRLAPLPDGTLRVRTDWWNDVLFALYAEGAGVSGAPIEE